MKALYQWSLAVLAGAALGAVTVQGLRAQAQPPVYVVAEIDVTDPATYQTYVERNGALVQSFGGRFLARGGKTEVIAGPPPQRTRGHLYLRKHGEDAGVARFRAIQGVNRDPRSIVQLSLLRC
jgi:hypothetical protein